MTIEYHRRTKQSGSDPFESSASGTWPISKIGALLATSLFRHPGEKEYSLIEQYLRLVVTLTTVFVRVIPKPTERAESSFI